jgi:hypothetical protein
VKVGGLKTEASPGKVSSRHYLKNKLKARNRGVAQVAECLRSSIELNPNKVLNWTPSTSPNQKKKRIGFFLFSFSPLVHCLSLYNKIWFIHCLVQKTLTKPPRSVRQYARCLEYRDKESLYNWSTLYLGKSYLEGGVMGASMERCHSNWALKLCDRWRKISQYKKQPRRLWERETYVQTCFHDAFPHHQPTHAGPSKK